MELEIRIEIEIKNPRYFVRNGNGKRNGFKNDNRKGAWHCITVGLV